MNRGDLVIVAARGHYSGKPCPALILQADVFAELKSVVVCLLSTELANAPLLRLTVGPTPKNGLSQVCQIMVDKIVTMPRERAGSGRHPLPILWLEVCVGEQAEPPISKGQAPAGHIPVCETAWAARVAIA